jgi:hypothetical protein
MSTFRKDRGPHSKVINSAIHAAHMHANLKSTILELLPATQSVRRVKDPITGWLEGVPEHIPKVEGVPKQRHRVPPKKKNICMW